MPEAYYGEIAIFPYDFVPRGWARCDGALLSISQNQALFSLLGITHGGDGKTTFALPDMRTNTKSAQGHYEHKGLEGTQLFYYICLQGYFPPRGQA